MTSELHESGGDVERLIDASLNRCTEALRVVEDVARFHWSFSAMSAELKDLRHAVLRVFASTPEKRAALTRCRDIEGDVGTVIASPPRDTISTASPDPLFDVAQSNLQRAKEALRSLEEVARANAPMTSKKIESLRYRLYSVEKGLVHLATGSASQFAGRHLCLLATRSLCRGPFDDIVAGSIEGGVDVVQLREKELSDRELLSLARSLRQRTANAGVLLVINDRADIARLVGADAVQLGQGDLPPAEVRRILGDRVAIGVSTHSVEEARAAAREGADYIGIGPVFPTSTKDAGPSIDPQGFAEIQSVVDVPGYAIGGISPENIAPLAAAGAKRIAVSGALLRAESGAEAREAAQQLLLALKH